MRRTAPEMAGVGVVLLLLRAAPGLAAPPRIGGIEAIHHGGQTFVQWEERADPAWYTLNVYRSVKPIAALDTPDVQCLARELIPRSGRDFYALKRAGYARRVPGLRGQLGPTVHDGHATLENVPGTPLPGGRGRSSPTGGLFVHTVRAAGTAYYAVTCSDSNGAESAELVAGDNALAAPVEELVQTPEPYRVDADDVVFPDGKRRTLLYLYAISGTADMTFAAGLGGHVKSYLFWMPGELGWREGLPTLFHVRYKPDDDLYELWPDDSNFAFMGFGNSWWYGYNREILHPAKLADGVVQDYSHRKLDVLIDWAFKTHPGLDRDHFVATGSSMGGTGALCYGIRRPGLFAVVEPWVPAVDVVKLAGADPSLRMLFGPLEQPVKTWNGRVIWDELSNTHYVSHTTADLPFLRIMHMRHDTWMVWQHNIPFYEALERKRHGWMAWWGPAGHSGGSAFCPRFWYDHPVRDLPLNSSFLAFSRCSLNERWGDGSPDDGDLYGGANVHLAVRVVRDTPDAYEAQINLNRPSPGVTVDITLRRRQAFQPQPGETVAYSLATRPAQSGTVVVSEQGMLTLENMGPIRPGTVSLTLTRQVQGE